MSKHYGRPRPIRRIVCLFTGHIGTDDDERTCYCAYCGRCGTKIEACVLHGWRLRTPGRVRKLLRKLKLDRSTWTFKLVKTETRP